MSWRVPDFSIGGLELVRSTIAPARSGADYHGPEWMIFGVPIEVASGMQSLAIAGDFHQVTEGVLLGCSAHVILEGSETGKFTQESADDIAEQFGPWVCEALWDFMGAHLRSLASTGRVDFDIPIKAPTPAIERLASASDDDGSPG